MCVCVCDEVGGSVCPSVENPDLVLQKTGYSKSPTHSRTVEYGSRQTVQARPDYPHRVVSPPRGLTCNMQQVAPTSDRPLCYEVQQQTGSVCVTRSGPPGLGSLPWEDLDPYVFQLVAILGKVVEKLRDYPCMRIILITPVWPNMSWFWDLVTMSNQIPLCLPHLLNLLTQPFILHTGICET